MGQKRECAYYWILTTQRKSFSFQVPDVCVKFRHNRLKIVTVRARTDKHTLRQTDSGDLKSVPCYATAMGQNNNQTAANVATC